MHTEAGVRTHMPKTMKAISPVIATVIIVAVAIAIAVAVVGWLMGLWSGLAGGTPQISITNVKVLTDGTVELYLVNSGSGSDKILRAELIHGTTVYTLNPSSSTEQCATIDANTNTVTIQANCRTWLTFAPANAATLTAGDSVTIKLYFDKSGTQTIQAVVSPG